MPTNKERLIAKINYLAYKAECQGYAPIAAYQKACQDVIELIEREVL